MDDFFEHLGIALLIIIGAVAQIIKVTRKTGKNAKTPSVGTDAPVCEGTVYGDTAFSEVMPKAIQHLQSTPVKPKKHKKSFSASMDFNREHTAENKPKSGVESTEDASPAVSADDFDIRQAIIYSEIMTPKFKEE